MADGMMSFGQAYEEVRGHEGKRIARHGWKDSSIWLQWVRIDKEHGKLHDFYLGDDGKPEDNGTAVFGCFEDSFPCTRDLDMSDWFVMQDIETGKVPE
jgi:hypothetical protein